MENFSERYDVIVIGGGLAGLSCAAHLVSADQRVLLLEKNLRLGGYATSYTVKGHRFDIAVQAIGGCDPQGAVYRLIRDFGLEDSINFLRCEPARAYCFDDVDAPWMQPGSLPGLIDSLCETFPAYTGGIKECYQTWVGIMAELERIALDGKSAVFGFSRNYPLLAGYSSYTLKQFLDERGFPDRLQMLVSARHGYCMLPPEKLSLVGFACTEMTYGKGAWMVEGGMSRLIGALASAISESGASLQNRSKVVALNLVEGKISGVRTVDGRRFFAPCVVLASAAPLAFAEWPGLLDLLPSRYVSRLRSMTATGSYYIGYYSVPAEAVKEGMWPNMEIRISANQNRSLWPPAAFYVLIPSLIDPSAAPPGFHCFCLSVPCPPENTDGTINRLACRRFLEREVTTRFPALKDRLEFLFELGPEQLAAISGNPGGSAYGWSLTPEQSGVKRLPMTTPVPGLYLAGHWTMPGGGIPGVVTSGQLCAQAVLAAHRTGRKEI